MKLADIDQSPWETWDELPTPAVRKVKNFYQAARWRELRARVLEEYGHVCMRCDRIDTRMHVDHVRPRSKYPQLQYDFDNLQVLCGPCNLNKSIDTVDYRRRYHD